MINPGPVAVFDSGYGGLTILKDLIKTFPDFDFIYFGDNARAPYGNRSFEVVYEYTREAVHTLFKMNAHLIILACNTASAKALRTIQQVDLPKIDPSRRVLGVIRPSVEQLGAITKTGHVAILGTSGTIASNSYPIEINKLFPKIEVEQEACPMWVSLVENNEYQSEGAHYFVKKSLDNLFLKAPKTDTLILGCTHYPLLLPVIKQHVPKNVQIISQGPIVTESLKDYLERHHEMAAKISRNGTRTFYTSEYPSRFNETASIFLGNDIDAIHLDAHL